MDNPSQDKLLLDVGLAAMAIRNKKTPLQSDRLRLYLYKLQFVSHPAERVGTLSAAEVIDDVVPLLRHWHGEEARQLRAALRGTLARRNEPAPEVTILETYQLGMPEITRQENGAVTIHKTFKVFAIQ
jgi:hypothetical protein